MVTSVEVTVKSSFRDVGTEQAIGIYLTYASQGAGRKESERVVHDAGMEWGVGV